MGGWFAEASNWWFLGLALFIAVFALRVVTATNVVHAALFLVAALAGTAGLFLVLGAQFVAWVLVLVYIGAVVVLFLFGIMLTRAPMEGEPQDNDQRWPALVVSIFLLGVLIALLVDAFGANQIELTQPTTVAQIGDSVFRTFVVPFEVVSMLLLGALVGAVALARRD